MAGDEEVDTKEVSLSVKMKIIVLTIRNQNVINLRCVKNKTIINKNHEKNTRNYYFYDLMY